MFIPASTLYFAQKRKTSKKRFIKKSKQYLPTGFKSWDSYFKAREAFYYSREWQEIKRRVFEAYPHKCAKCGCSGSPENHLEVDHKEPLWRAWYRRLDFSNLQILCHLCNTAKGGLTDREFRSGKKQKCQKTKKKKK